MAVRITRFDGTVVVLGAPTLHVSRTDASVVILGDPSVRISRVDVQIVFPANTFGGKVIHSGAFDGHATDANVVGSGTWTSDTLTSGAFDGRVVPYSGTWASDVGCSGTFGGYATGAGTNVIAESWTCDVEWNGTWIMPASATTVGCLSGQDVVPTGLGNGKRNGAF